MFDVFSPLHEKNLDGKKSGNEKTVVVLHPGTVQPQDSPQITRGNSSEANTSGDFGSHFFVDLGDFG